MDRRLQGLAAVAVGLLAVVGPRAVLDALAAVSPRRLAVLAAVAAVPIVVWGASLRVALGGVGVESSLARAIAGFTAVSYCNLVTPFGQTGGDPPAGAVIARGFRCSFEAGLAAVGAVNLCNRIAAVALGAVAFLVSVGTTGSAATGGLLVSLAGVAAIPLVWRFRRPLVRRTVGLLATVFASFDRLPTRAELRDRGERFLTAIDRLATQPRRLVALLGAGVVGQLLVAATLWVALRAVGVRVPPATVLVAVPAAKVGGLTPTPGGTGGVETTLVAVVVAAGGDPPAAAAGVLVYRLAAFWLPAAVGGVAAGWLVASPDRSPGPRLVLAVLLAVLVGLAVFLAVPV